LSIATMRLVPAASCSSMFGGGALRRCYILLEQVIRFGGGSGLMKCELERITVNYEVRGEGRPIFILHGWPIDHRVMVGSLEPVFERRDGWKRIYPDLPGMGRTPGMDWITSQDQVLDIVLEFIATMAPEQRFAVAGFSYGGYLARGVVHKNSRLMDGMCIVAPAVESDSSQRVLPQHVTLFEDPDLMATLEEEVVADFGNFAVVQCQELLDARRTLAVPARKIADYDFLSRLRENYAFSFDVDLLPEPFGGPTLIFVGRQDSIAGYRGAMGLLENYSRGTLAVLDRAGHGLMAEQKSLFNALVSEWLDRVEEYAETSE